MKNILIIARWELIRIRARFGRRSGIPILVILLLAAGAALLAYQQGMVISKGLYSLGVSSDASIVSDQRFSVRTVGPDTGRALLSQGELDIYLDGERVISGNDDRSQYATGALKEYFEREELLRIADEYPLSQAFPLRIDVRYFDIRNDSLTSAPVDELPPVEETINPEMIPGDSGSGQTPEGTLETTIREQLDRWQAGGLANVKEAFAGDDSMVIPSLMPPVVPLAHVTLAFLFVLPVLFTCVFFAGSLTEERVSRKLNILISTPVSPLQVIMGKMLPYVLLSLAAITVITVFLDGNILINLAIFIPVTLFIFSVYLMLALNYRTFKDQTFLSILILSALTAYLIIPALLVGVNDLSYISPLTLVVEMLRGEGINIGQYLLAIVPLFLFSLLLLFIGTRAFNEEFLSGFKPLRTKMVEMIHLTMNKRHLNLSVFLSSVFLLPAVFMAELALIVLVSNAPVYAAVPVVIVLSAAIEELAKSIGIYSLIHHYEVKKPTEAVRLAVVSALGFFIGEKGFLLLALGVLSESVFISGIFNSELLVMPLILHGVSTTVTGFFTVKFGTKYYPLALTLGTIIHAAYNILMIQAFL